MVFRAALATWGPSCREEASPARSGPASRADGFGDIEGGAEEGTAGDVAQLFADPGAPRARGVVSG